jgi:type III secretory pathway component EscR
MDERLLDVIIGFAAFLILVVLLAVLPMAMASGTGYLVAIIVFILFLSGAGYLVNGKIT